METFEACIRMKPNMFEPMVNLGVLYTTSQFLHKAADIYGRALLLAPDNAPLLNNAAHLYLTQHQYLRAYNYSSRAMAVMPHHHHIKTTHQSTTVGMGHYHYTRREYADAMEWYYKAPSIQPASPNVLEYIVKTYIKLNQYQEGLPHLHRLIELLPDRTESKTWLMHIEQGTMKSSAVSDVNDAD